MDFLQSAGKFLKYVTALGIVNFILEWNLLPQNKKCTNCGGIVYLTSNGRNRDVIDSSGTRELLRVWLFENEEKIGGPKRIFLNDESAFGKRKHNQGRKRKTRWVVGDVDRESKKCSIF